MLQIAAELVKRVLGGIRISSGYLCRCPVASHGQGRGDRNPSMFVSDGDRGLGIHCFAGCDKRAIKAALDHLDLTQPNQPFPVSRPAKPPRKTSADALALWRAAKPVPGTSAEKYLAARGLPLPPPTLRYLPNVPFFPKPPLRLPDRRDTGPDPGNRRGAADIPASACTGKSPRHRTAPHLWPEPGRGAAPGRTSCNPWPGRRL